MAFACPFPTRNLLACRCLRQSRSTSASPRPRWSARRASPSLRKPRCLHELPDETLHRGADPVRLAPVISVERRVGMDGGVAAIVIVVILFVAGLITPGI